MDLTKNARGGSHGEHAALRANNEFDIRRLAGLLKVANS